MCEDCSASYGKDGGSQNKASFYLSTPLTFKMSKVQHPLWMVMFKVGEKHKVIITIHLLSITLTNECWLSIPKIQM